MELSDAQINIFVSRVLKLPPGKRKEYIAQVDFLIGRLESKIRDDGSFQVKGFKKTGSLAKGTVLRPRGDDGVDADVAVYLDVSDSDKGDIELLHRIILKLVRSMYPQKADQDFKVQPRTLGVHFRASELDIDLVPIVPIPDQPGYGWQPSSEGGEPIKTNVQRQLDFVRKRSDADVSFRTLVRLVKKWRNERELESFRSFLVELVLAHVQDRHGQVSSLEDGLLRFFLYLAKSGFSELIAFPENGAVKVLPKDSVVVLDPVNSENNVARRLTQEDRKRIAAEAVRAWEKLSAASFAASKGETTDLWKEVFGRSFEIEA